jgi:hypothetical protein
MWGKGRQFLLFSALRKVPEVFTLKGKSQLSCPTVTLLFETKYLRGIIFLM